MQITRRNPFTGDHHTQDIAVTAEQLHAWQNGALIQDAMPNLTADEREFILTGMLPEQWNEVFGSR